MSSDRRTGTICLIHGTPYMQCACPERRTDSTTVSQVVRCEFCNSHFSECACAEPDLQIRAAV